MSLELCCEKICLMIFVVVIPKGAQLPILLWAPANPPLGMTPTIKMHSSAFKVYILGPTCKDAHYVYTNTRACPPAKWKAEILGFPTVYDMPILPRKCLRMHHLCCHFRKFSGGGPPDLPLILGFSVSCQICVPLILHNGRP